MQSGRKIIWSFFDTGLQSTETFYHWVYLVYFEVNYFEINDPLKWHISLFFELFKDDFMHSGRKIIWSFFDTGLQCTETFYHWVYLVYFEVNYFEINDPLKWHISLFFELFKDDFMQSSRKIIWSVFYTGLQSYDYFYHWVYLVYFEVNYFKIYDPLK
jgi:hypothetical protein